MRETLPIGLLLSDDLIDSSRVITTGKSLNLTIKQMRTWSQLVDQLQSNVVSCIIVDLHHPELQLEELVRIRQSQSTKPRIIGYGSHVDAIRLKSARQAGLDQVMPRSQFFEELNTQLPNWLN
jgi:PleD family two-component response regulator